ncbi:hypothetical protein ACUUL3_16105 [Thiovibrio sp. JS02]
MAEEVNGSGNVVAGDDTALLKLRVHPDLYRAFQRCVWILVHETGKTQVEIMNEMVRDFLVKHEC